MKIEKIINKALESQAVQIEEYVRLHIQPKPKWLPDFLWKKILSRLLILERR